MPKINHPDIGNIARTKYLTGTIIAITDNDTCTVDVGGQIFESVPIYYHCDNTVTLQANGSLEGAAGAFAAGDEVIGQLHDGTVRVIGHADGVKRPCGVDWLTQLSLGGSLAEPGDFVLEFIGITFTMWVVDKDDIDIGFNIEYDEDSNFLGFWDSIDLDTDTPDPAVNRGASLGGADLGGFDFDTKILNFSSNPPGWNPPGTPSGIWKMVAVQIGPVSITYEDKLGFQFIGGAEMVPGPIVYRFIQ